MLARSFLCALLMTAATACVAQDAAKAPVVLELFTSEGCSSCPPADSLLLQLERQQQFEGIPVLVLGEHVDYWDHEGWRDRFSSPAFTQRQHEYQAKLRFQEPYTPQVIVNGSYEVVGSDAAALGKAIHTAAAQRNDVALSVQRTAPETFEFAVANPGHRKTRLLLAVVEAGLESKVSAGENRGRQIQHPAVVRRFSSLKTSSDESFKETTRVKLEREWNADHVRVIAFVQDVNSGAILGSTGVPVK